MNKCLLVSGWACPDELLHPLAENLAGVCECSTYAFDALPDMSSPDKEYTAEVSEYARGLLKLLKDITEPVVLIGWSAGGLAVIESVLTCKDKVKALVLINSTARFCASPDYTHGWPLSVVRAMSIGLKKDPAAVLARFFLDAAYPDSELSSALQRVIDDARNISAAVLQQGLRYLQRVDMLERLDMIGLPVLVIHAEEDRIIPVEAGRCLAEGIAGASMTRISGRGHDMPVRHHEELSIYIKDFLSKLD
ncbi:MAG: alpha/beta fold hydrolase [Nitrospira sp.]|nr:alpha/beta fold hydrolase [bacterium]MBL7050007.1 alpha/beta fold hydrolase [Nitrospira sp.]